MNDQAVINWVKGCFRPKSRANSFFIWNPPTDLKEPNQFAYLCDGFSLLRVELNHKVFHTVSLPDPDTEYRWDLGWKSGLRNPLKPDRVAPQRADQMLPLLQTRYGDPRAMPAVTLTPYLFESGEALHRIFMALGEPAFCVDKRSLDLLDSTAAYLQRYTFRCGGPIAQKPLVVLEGDGVVLWAMRTEIKEPLHF